MKTGLGVRKKCEGGESEGVINFKKRWEGLLKKLTDEIDRR